MSKLSHLDQTGAAHMVDVGHKTITQRTAQAGGYIQLSPTAFAALMAGNAPKGDVLSTARLAAIMAAKQTAGLIPLCHTLPLDSVQVALTPDADNNRVYCRVTVATTAKTGVEMEALVGVQIGLLTVYDMLKAVDKRMMINDIHLLQKRGGASGDFNADA